MKTLGSEGFYWSICPTPSIYSLGWLLTLEKQCSDPSPLALPYQVHKNQPLCG